MEWGHVCVRVCGALCKEHCGNQFFFCGFEKERECLSTSPPRPFHMTASHAADALRAAALAALADDGALDALRASARAALIARLLGAPSAEAALAPPPAPGCPFARSADALVADHLAATGRGLALAVFVPEARLEGGGARPASAAELAALCRLDASPVLGAAVAAAAERAVAAGGTAPSFAACLLAGVAEGGGEGDGCARCRRRRRRGKGGA